MTGNTTAGTTAVPDARHRALRPLSPLSGSYSTSRQPIFDGRPLSRRPCRSATTAPAPTYLPNQTARAGSTRLTLAGGGRLSAGRGGEKHERRLAAHHPRSRFGADHRLGRHPGLQRRRDGGRGHRRACQRRWECLCLRRKRDLWLPVHPRRVALGGRSIRPRGRRRRGRQRRRVCRLAVAVGLVRDGHGLPRRAGWAEWRDGTLARRRNDWVWHEHRFGRRRQRRWIWRSPGRRRRDGPDFLRRPKRDRHRRGPLSCRRDGQRHRRDDGPRSVGRERRWLARSLRRRGPLPVEPLRWCPRVDSSTTMSATSAASPATSTVTASATSRSTRSIAVRRAGSTMFPKISPSRRANCLRDRGHLDGDGYSDVIFWIGSFVGVPETTRLLRRAWLGWLHRLAPILRDHDFRGTTTARARRPRSSPPWGTSTVTGSTTSWPPRRTPDGYPFQRAKARPEADHLLLSVPLRPSPFGTGLPALLGTVLPVAL